MSNIKNCCTTNDLRKLEVINICDGKRLGCITDIELNLCDGCIVSVLIPKRFEFSDLFFKREKKWIRIPWCRIERIGDDIVLVRIEACDC